MATAVRRSTRTAIVQAAWQLFRARGYQDTTMEEIIEAAGVSRGTFYHHFHGKDALLSSLSELFDEEYRTLEPQLDDLPTAGERLLFLNRELFAMIDEDVPVELLASLYSSQLETKGDRHLLDRNRLYYRLLDRIVSEGQLAGEIVSPPSSQEIVRVYALCERALLYEWCITQGEPRLSDGATDLMAQFMAPYIVG
ncbi:MAG TPA: TetR/AcrR family transcriptional regulator [Pseudoclavibacter sp.]|nr:TetR/AcrR family transcriptional regulator [Pseudoclavibacter sp.]